MAIDDGLDWFLHPEEFEPKEYQRMLMQEIIHLRGENSRLRNRLEIYETEDFRDSEEN